MWLKSLCIIFCISAPQICNADTELTQQKTKLLAEKPNLPKEPEKQAPHVKAHELANFALKNLSNQNHPAALIAIEKSLSLNPYRFKSHRLRSQILDQLQLEPSQSIPFYVYFLRTMPAPLLILIFAALLIYSAKLYGRYKHLEKQSMKNHQDLQLKSYTTAAAAFLVFILVFLKTVNQKRHWACITDSQPVYTGPSIKLPIVKSLKPGSCFIKRKTTSHWTSIQSADNNIGWLENTSIKEVQVSK